MGEISSGPWELEWNEYLDGTKEILGIVDANGEALVVTVAATWDDLRLMMAAPDLLAACEELARWFKAGGPIKNKDHPYLPQYPATQGFGMAIQAIDKAKKGEKHE